MQVDGKCRPFEMSTEKGTGRGMMTMSSISPIQQRQMSMSHRVTCPPVSSLFEGGGWSFDSLPHHHSRSKRQVDSSANTLVIHPHYKRSKSKTKKMLVKPTNMPIGYDLFGDISFTKATSMMGTNNVNNNNNNNNNSNNNNSNSTTNDKEEQNSDNSIEDNDEKGIILSDDVKRQERAIKNRISAQASRERKRQYVNELEEERGELAKSCQTLHAKINNLESEKVGLINELSNLKNEFEQLKKIVLSNAFNSSVPLSTCTTPISTTTTTINKEGEDECHYHHHYHQAQAQRHCKAKPSSLTNLNGNYEMPIEDSLIYKNKKTLHNMVTGLDLSASQCVWREPEQSTKSTCIAPLTINAKSHMVPPAHSPSTANTSHLLVSSELVTISPDQNPRLNHVMRLRLRYRRRPMINSTLAPSQVKGQNGNRTISTMMHSSVNSMKTVQKMRMMAMRRMTMRRMTMRKMTTSGSVRGNNTLDLNLQRKRGLLLEPTRRRTIMNSISSQKSRFNGQKQLSRQRMTHLWDQIINGCLKKRQMKSHRQGKF